MTNLPKQTDSKIEEFGHFVVFWLNRDVGLTGTALIDDSRTRPNRDHERDISSDPVDHW